MLTSHGAAVGASGGGMDASSIISSVAGGGIVMAIVGFIKDQMGK
jgi:hypothetical protein